MRKAHPHFLAVFIMLLCANACDESDHGNAEISQNCQITYVDCASQGKTLDATTCACVESPIAQECKTEGFVKCGNTCIDPKSSIAYCGANENCENYITCKDSETCTEGRCRPTKCESNEHFYDVICEKDSIDNCGEHGLKCAEQVEGWKSGDCTDKACVPSACAAGRHPFGNTCEPDEANHCGSHNTDCSIKIAGWSEGTCTNGAC